MLVHLVPTALMCHLRLMQRVGEDVGLFVGLFVGFGVIGGGVGDLLGELVVGDEVGSVLDDFVVGSNGESLVGDPVTGVGVGPLLGDNDVGCVVEIGAWVVDSLACSLGAVVAFGAGGLVVVGEEEYDTFMGGVVGDKPELGPFGERDASGDRVGALVVPGTSTAIGEVVGDPDLSERSAVGESEETVGFEEGGPSDEAVGLDVVAFGPMVGPFVPDDELGPTDGNEVGSCVGTDVEFAVLPSSDHTIINSGVADPPSHSLLAKLTLPEDWEESTAYITIGSSNSPSSRGDCSKADLISTS